MFKFCDRGNFLLFERLLYVLSLKISRLLDHLLCVGIYAVQPSCFHPRPSGRDNAELCEGLDVWKLCLALCLQN